MPGIRARISLRTVAGLKRGDWITDDALPGFKARRPNKLVLYGVNIRLNGRMRWISLGSENDLTPDKARSEAEKVRGLKRQGVDPATERDRRKTGTTVQAAYDRFKAEHIDRKLRKTTQAMYREHFDKIVLPKFGGWRLDALTVADVATWHANLENTPYRANRALAVLSSLYGWAIKRRFTSANPCAGVAHFTERSVNRYPSPQAIAALLAAADELASEERISLFFSAGLRVLATTGARRSEIFTAKWEWLDIDRGDLVLPDSKTGPKRIALPETALQLIADLPKLDGSPYIFPSTKRGAPFVNFNAAWSAVLKRADVGHWRIHDLRHGFASAAVAAGASLFTVGSVLGHARPITTQRYSHIGDDPKRLLIERIAGEIGGRS
jgi:integrase